MHNSASTPALTDLYRLGQQIDADREQPVAQLRQRDHEIGQACNASDDAGRLLFWLHKMQGVQAAEGDDSPWLNEHSAALLLRVFALGAGFITMLGFLLASGRGLVNVFLFLLIFVLLQLLFSMAAAVVMLRSLRGNAPASFPLNPARFVTARVMPDRRYLREASGVLRLLLLRYGQEFGAVFTLGAITAFMCLLAFSDFSFVWGSTFSVSDDFASSFTGLLSAPWSTWLPQGVLSPQMIAETRYNPALVDLSQISDDSRRGWWPFLLMCMLVYALLPRLLLWTASRLAYTRELTRSFVCFPGAEVVLSRMRRPVVNTQAVDEETAAPALHRVALDEGLMLLDWAGALAGERASFEVLLSVPPGNQVAGGLGSPADDATSVSAVNTYGPETLLVAVKAWEPPMADLADVLAGVTSVPRCTVCLVPLPGKAVTEHSLQEWQAFSRELPFAVASAQALEWL